VRDLNTKIDSFPSNMVARAFSFAKKELFEIAEVTQRETPDVSFEESNK
jgi:LemA protein